MADGLEIATFPRGAERPPAIDELAAAIESDGGAALAAYQEPLGSHWQIFALVPAAMLKGTPFQRDLSPAHLKRLGEVMKQLRRFTSPARRGQARGRNDPGNRDRGTRGRLPDSRAQHPEGAQPQGQGARGDPDVPRAPGGGATRD